MALLNERRLKIFIWSGIAFVLAGYIVSFALGAEVVFPPVKHELVLPDHEMTPGEVRALSFEQICATRWGRDDRRHVTAAMKRQVYVEYGLTGPDDASYPPDKNGRRYEVDHLVPRCLGGADKVKNLWPQPYGTQPWNATRKDRLEARLCKDVCAHRVTLDHARQIIRDDYREAYREYFGKP